MGEVEGGDGVGKQEKAKRSLPPHCEKSVRFEFVLFICG